MPPALFPILLLVHVALALALFLPSFLLPFAFRARRGPLSSERPAAGGGAGAAGAAGGPGAAGGAAAAGGPGAFVRFLLWLQARGTIWIGIGLAVTGVGLLATIGFETLRQPWLLAALAIYAANLGLAYFVQVPRLRRLIGLRGDSDPRWAALARRQRYISYVMAGLVGTIGFLMSTKPALW